MMNSKVSFSVLAVAILCLVPMTSSHSTYSMEQKSTSTSSSSNSTSSQATVTVGSTEQPRWQDHERDEGPQPTKTSRAGDDDFSDSNSSAPKSKQPSRTIPESYEEEPDYSGDAPLARNSTFVSDPSASYADTPTPTLNCPGPIDPATGEGYLDSDQNCSIACYNNLVLNQSGDACVCAPTFQFDPVEVKCVCPSPFVLRGSKCVLLPSQAAGARHSGHKKRSLNSQWTFGVEDKLHGKYLRNDVDRKFCPDSEIACRMSSGGYECLDPDVTLESCGGCSSIGTGVDCRNITGADEVGCYQGACQVITCGRGFRLIDGSCIRNVRRR
ncbi:hypothetical protein Pst134EA_024193 [Puccinia striiformis f. sp. tritici]|uniref:hypothetical protein n=1 Tax=Puccinia striiformis f. sp. tritici TaxID=168172 RepID=UPI002007C2A9|nr:hypothetical protein Pst134EA_024193 [Puccinia striiformis f. sp. tritici]KAH9453313.1 hypothetical protein Pst134EA_024193 [Puccinia striiformis f. sp. tritici]KAI9606648.1 hypothetical protein H4Q26_006184 [Puccinia striiformis f. sp. tritici PST-130]